MISSSSEPVFIGVVVNPKTKAPVYIVRPAYSNSINIYAAEAGVFGASIGSPRGETAYLSKGAAYLNDDRYYAGPTEVTGLPRSHTPAGVQERGSGFGTCLYTGLVLLAAARYEGEISVRDVIGDGPGICSTPSDGTRSKEADAWWNGAVARGLAARSSGYTEGDEPEEETETDSGDLDSYINRTGLRRVHDQIAREIENTEWNLKDVEEIRVEVERTLPSETERESELITVDEYRIDAARRFNLVAVQRVMRGDILAWAAEAPRSMGLAAKDVILALNVSREDVRVVAKLALLARDGGASEAEIAAMLMRNRFGADVTSRHITFDRPQVPVATSVTVAPRRRGPPSVSKHRGVGMAEPMQNPPPMTIRRNPAVPAAAEQRAIEAQLGELERRRADLGWDDLGDL